MRAINLFPTGKMSSCYLSKFGKGSRNTESFVFLEKAPGTKKVHIMKSSSPSHQPTQRQNGEGRERNGSSSVEEKKKKSEENGENRLIDEPSERDIREYH